MHEFPHDRRSGCCSCCDAGFVELEFESISLVADAQVVSSVLPGGGDALVGGLVSAGLGAVAAPSLRALSAASVVGLQ